MEGWAVYAEKTAYDFAGLDEDVAELLATDDTLMLYLYAKADIGVNARGWNKNDVARFLSEIGIDDEATATTMYDAHVAEPGNYLKYAIGYLEVSELRDRAQEALSDDFDLKAFHEFLLETGPAFFDIVGDRLELWIAEEGGKAAA
jgi:uncharacterized protein (DUF885 family)